MFLVVAVGVTLLLSVVASQSGVAYVAFTAGFRSTQTIGSGQIVIYPDVSINFGSGYNSNTGIFTAPKAGLYLFLMHALAPPHGDAWIHLYRNHVSVVSGYGNNGALFATAANSAILQLKKGDIVYVKTRRILNLYGGPDEVYATFSGLMFGELIKAQ